MAEIASGFGPVRRVGHCPVVVYRRCADGAVHTLCGADGEPLELASYEYALQFLAIHGYDPEDVRQMMIVPVGDDDIFDMEVPDA